LRLRKASEYNGITMNDRLLLVFKEIDMTEQKQGNPMKTVIIAVVVIAVAVGGAFLMYHNRFVKADENINEMWGRCRRSISVVRTSSPIL